MNVSKTMLKNQHKLIDRNSQNEIYSIRLFTNGKIFSIKNPLKLWDSKLIKIIYITIVLIDFFSNLFKSKCEIEILNEISSKKRLI